MKWSRFVSKTRSKVISIVRTKLLTKADVEASRNPVQRTHLVSLASRSQYFPFDDIAELGRVVVLSEKVTSVSSTLV